jgi:molybdopterin-guanine dinucleotide biosynthesis protein A
MTILGVVLAGGQSSRFGSDKALALWNGVPLIDHALAALTPFVDQRAVVGRDWPGTIRVDDLPRPGLGPLGGLMGALAYAADKGFEAVLSCGCDTLGLAAAHVAALTPGPSVLEALPIIGLWPADLAPELQDWMATHHRHSVYAFAQAVGARRVAVPNPPANINRPEDLAARA